MAYLGLGPELCVKALLSRSFATKNLAAKALLSKNFPVKAQVHYMPCYEEKLHRVKLLLSTCFSCTLKALMYKSVAEHLVKTQQRV